MPEKPGYKDDGSSSSPSASGRCQGYALGCTAKERLRHVLADFGFGSIALALNGPVTFKEALAACLAADADMGREVCLVLVNDGRAHVRADLAAQLPRVVPSILETLADDRDPSVRIAVTCNPYTPDFLRDRLKDDPNKYVRMAAKGETMEVE